MVLSIISAAVFVPSMVAVDSSIWIMLKCTVEDQAIPVETDHKFR